MKLSRVISVLIAAFAIIFLVVIDQLTKFFASHNELLINGEEIIFIKHILSFKLAFNKGAAWSILSGEKFFLVSISLIASIIFVYLIIKLVDFKERILLSIALILIEAGAIGNLIDRAFYENGVIDFLNFMFMDFPTFNFADTCLTIGAVVLVVYILFFYKEPEKHKNNDNINEQGEENDVKDSVNCWKSSWRT